MSTVVYLFNQQVQVVLGNATKTSVSVKQYHTFDAPEGSIINGMIMDYEMFSSFMAEIWESNHFAKKDVTLVINSTKFIGRSIEMPALNEAKTYDFITREYSNMGREEELMFSFIQIGKGENKRKKVYSEGIEPDFIKDYLDLFAQFGVKLSAVYSGESSLITFTEQTAAKDHRTFVLLLADTITLTTLLWVDGSFYYYNSARCFHDPGTIEYAEDIARSLSQLTQFLKANQIESPLETIQLAGVQKEDEAMYKEAIEYVGITVPISVFQLKTGGSYVLDPNIQGYLHAIAGLYNGGKNENFMIQYTQLEKRKKNQVSESGRKNIILIGSVFAVMLVALIVCLVIKIGKERELAILNEYNESQVIQFQVMDYYRLENRNNFLQSQYDAIHSLDENLVTYPTGTDKVKDVIDACALGYANIEYNSFDAENGTISISANAKNVEDINKFIKKLMEQNTFSDINYTGYDYQDGTAMWQIKVTCTLAESAGR